MLKIGKLILGAYATNVFFVYEQGKNEVIVFDPADEGGFIYDKLKENGFEIAAIYITHGHHDHIGGAEELRAKSGAKIYCLDKEEDFCADVSRNLGSSFGLTRGLKVDGTVRDGDVVTVAGMTFTVIATPGHTAGGCVYYFKDGGFIIGGDTLFFESIGRTDMPTGDGPTLLRSIKEKLFVLPDDTRVYCGHGEATTIGHEKENNYWVQ